MSCLPLSFFTVESAALESVEDSMKKKKIGNYCYIKGHVLIYPG